MKILKKIVSLLLILTIITGTSLINVSIEDGKLSVGTTKANADVMYAYDEVAFNGGTSMGTWWYHDTTNTKLYNISYNRTTGLLSLVANHFSQNYEDGGWGGSSIATVSVVTSSGTVQLFKTTPTYTMGGGPYIKYYTYQPADWTVSNYIGANLNIQQFIITHEHYYNGGSRYEKYTNTYNTIPSSSAPPTLTLTSPVANTIYKPVLPYNAVRITGSVSDPDANNIINMNYSIDGGPTRVYTTNILQAGTFDFEVGVGNLAYGAHNIKIWASDGKGSSTAYTVPFTLENCTPANNVKFATFAVPATGDSTDHKQSRTISIPNAKQIFSVRGESGELLYTQSGTNLTLNCQYGNVTRMDPAQGNDTIVRYETGYVTGRAFPNTTQGQADAQAYAAANPRYNGKPFFSVSHTYHNEEGERWYSWDVQYGSAEGTQHPVYYTGTVTNFYSYNVTVAYTDNTAPTINVTAPLSNSVYSAISGYNTIALSGTVSDVDNGSILTTKYNLDGGTAQVISGTVTTSGAFTNTNINVSSLTEGNHTLNVWVEDNYGGSSGITSIPFMIDKTLPVIGTVNITSSDTSITVTGSATDNKNLNSMPYQYTIGANSPSGWTTSTSYSKDLLMPNTLYIVKFEVRDKVGNIATNVQNIFTKASTPAVTVNNPTSTTLNINASDNSPATTEYQINLNNGSKYITPEGTLTTSPVWFTLPTKNITIKGLTPQTAYTFQAKARNTGGIETPWSSPVSGTTLVAPPVAPINIVATATNNSITVVWDQVASSAGYDIEVDGRIIDNGAYNSYTHTGLTPYTQHTYRIRAKNAGGLGAWSEQISKYTQQDNPNSPFNIDAAANNTSIIVTWKPIPGATAYDIEADGVVINNSSSTSYVHSNLIPGTMHSYRVRSINSGGKSEWSNEILVSTMLDAPHTPSNITTFASGDCIIVTWNPVQGTTYEVEADGTIRDNGTSSEFVHSGLASGSTHTYRVRAKQSGSISDWSTYATATLPMAEFGIPKNIQAEATDTTIALSWNPVIDAIGYDVEYDGSIIDNLTKPNCVFNMLTPNTQYVYRVRAKGIDKVSEWSEYKPVMTYALPTPTNLTTFATGDSISITWNGVPGAESYDLDIDGQLIQNITTTEYIHSLIDKNAQHTYKVRASNTTGFSAWSKAVSQIPQTGGTNAPVGIVGVSMNESIYMLWKPMSETTSYDIEVDGTIVQGITDSNYTHNGLEPGTQHSYRVRGINNGVQSDWSNTAMVMTLPVAPPTPTSVTASSTTSSVLITWDKIEDAAAYEIEVDGQIIDTGINTKYLHSNLAPDSSHTYRVRAKNISDWSLWSEALTTKTKSSVQTYDIQITSGQVFNLVLTANDIADPSKYTYTITYNADELEVLDLCASTSRTDMAVSGVVGADIQIVQYTQGTIVFKKLGTSAGQAWTGQINSIKFKSKTDQATQVIYSFE